MSREPERPDQEVDTAGDPLPELGTPSVEEEGGGEPGGAPASRGAPGGDAPARPTGARRAGLFALAFASGFAVLTIEIAGARLIAPVYGLSAVPWTAVIGVILAALAVGSHLGGRLADEGRVPLGAILVAAGAAAGLPLVAGGVPWIAREALGFVGGAVVSAAVLFAPAVLCLGAVVPYLVQADTESLGSVGRRAGDVSAAATAGSIAGSFVTGFVLLPAFPLPVLMGLTAAALFALAGLSGWILGRGVAAEVVGVGVVALGTLGFVAAEPAPGVLVQTQTLYASVQVTERPWSDGRVVRELWQNGGSSSAEYVETGAPAHAYARASLHLLEPLLPRVERALVLGGAALSLPVALTGWRPGMEVDVVEIDPAVTELARTHFAYGERERPRISVVHDDARVFLRRTEEAWELIYLDVFDHFLTVPWTVVTVEALSAMEARLAPGGLLMANVLSPLEGPGAGFLRRLLATAEEVFGAVRLYAADPSTEPGAVQNVILVAARDEADLAALPGGPASPTAGDGTPPPAAAAPGDAATAGGAGASAVPPSAAPGDPVPALLSLAPAGRPLTDAWAPVEYLQGRVFLEGIRWD